METKERENTNTRPRWINAKKAVEHLEMKFWGETYDTQFTTSAREKKKYFMHDMHKLAVGVKFTQITAKKSNKNHEKRAVEAMYR